MQVLVRLFDKVRVLPGGKVLWVDDLGTTFSMKPLESERELTMLEGSVHGVDNDARLKELHHSVHLLTQHFVKVWGRLPPFVLISAIDPDPESLVWRCGFVVGDLKVETEAPSTPWTQYLEQSFVVSPLR